MDVAATVPCTEVLGSGVALVPGMPVVGGPTRPPVDGDVLGDVPGITDAPVVGDDEEVGVGV